MFNFRYLLLALVAAVTVVSAHPSIRAPQGVPKLSAAADKCALDCASKAQGEFYCNAEDFGCISVRYDWRKDFTNCLSKQCGNDQEVIEKDFCATSFSHGVYLPLITKNGEQCSCGSASVAKPASCTCPQNVACVKCEANEHCTCPTGETCACPSGHKCACASGQDCSDV